MVNRHGQEFWQMHLEAWHQSGLDSYAWLKDTLEKLSTWPSSRLDELLPLRMVGCLLIRFLESHLSFVLFSTPFGVL